MRLTSEAGTLLDRVLELEWNIEHFHLNWSDVTAEECKALQILVDERNRYKRQQEDDRRG